MRGLPEASESAGSTPAPATSPSDREIVEEVLSGRREQFSVLVRRHQNALFRLAHSMGVDADTAADLVQDALVRAFDGLGDWREQGSFRVWVMRILRNRCLDHLKSAPTRRNRPLFEAIPLESGGPEEDHGRSLIRAAVEEAMERIPPDQREAFILRHVEDLSYEEMSQVIGASVSALKMRVHRAREVLREEMGRMGWIEDVTTGRGASS